MEFHVCKKCAVNNPELVSYNTKPVKVPSGKIKFCDKCKKEIKTGKYYTAN